MQVKEKELKIIVVGQTILVVVLAIALVFSSNGIKQLKREKKDIQIEYEAIQKVVNAKDKEIEQHLIVIKGLEKAVEKWDSMLPKKSFINEENITTLSSEYNSQIEFLSRYLSEVQQTDSLGR